MADRLFRLRTELRDARGRTLRDAAWRRVARLASGALTSARGAKRQRDPPRRGGAKGRAELGAVGAVAGAAEIAFNQMKDQGTDHRTFLVDLANNLDQIVYKCGASGERMMTMAFICLDYATKTIHYLNAGHNGIIVVSEQLAGVILKGGTPLGMKNGKFGYTSFAFDAGDIFVAYTDGLFEQVGQNGQTMKIKSVLKMIQPSMDSRKVRDLIQTTAESLWQGEAFQDDCTFVVLKAGKIDSEEDDLEGAS